MLTVSEWWNSYKERGKVHNFILIWFCPLIQHGYAIFVFRLSYAHALHHSASLTFLPPAYHTGRSSLGIYIFAWCAELKWSWLSEVSHQNCKSLESKRHRSAASLLVSLPPRPFFPLISFYAWWQSTRKRTTPSWNKATMYHLLKGWGREPICNFSLILGNKNAKLASLFLFGSKYTGRASRKREILHFAFTHVRHVTVQETPVPIQEPAACTLL